MRRRIFAIIEPATQEDFVSALYDYLITMVALISMIPLMFKRSYEIFGWIDQISFYVLFIDYILRWMVCDYKDGRSGVWSFLCYPFSPMAVVDLLSLLPSMGVLHSSFYILRLFRIFRILKLRHYSTSMMHILNAFKKERDIIISCMMIAVLYIFLTALLIFNCEGETFPSFFDALYWASITLTTVGYGDLYPITQLGKSISIVSSIFGIAVIALPAGVITASFMEEMQNAREEHLDISMDSKESIFKRILKLRFYHKMVLDKGEDFFQKIQIHKLTTKEVIDLYMKEKEHRKETQSLNSKRKPDVYLSIKRGLQRDVYIVKFMLRNKQRRKKLWRFLIRKRKIRYLSIMLLSVFINFGMHQLALHLNLPVWWDSVGTILSAVLLEPAAGILVGLVYQCQMAILVFGESSVLYFGATALTALIAGVGLCQDGEVKICAKRIIWTFIVMAVVTSLASELVNGIKYYWMPNSEWEVYLYWKFIKGGFRPFFAGLFSVFLIRSVDILVSFGILGMLYQILPKEWKKQKEKEGSI